MVQALTNIYHNESLLGHGLTGIPKQAWAFARGDACYGKSQGDNRSKKTSQVVKGMELGQCLKVDFVEPSADLLLFSLP